MQEEPVRVNPQDARQGQRGNKVSFVLLISLVLAAIIGAVLYATVF